MRGEWTAERQARAALTAACEAASPALVARVAEEGAEQVWRTLRNSSLDHRWSRRAKCVDVDSMLSRADELGIRCLVPGDAEWPQQLDVLDNIQLSGLGGRPLALWVRGPGDLARWTARSVALVGARASTHYGDQTATGLAMDLASQSGEGQPWTVVSGGAYGIDGAAHRGALAVGGRTVAVLAGGLDEPYPRGNAVLFDALVADHVLVGEAPCGMRPTRVAFLARNRLIAALAQGTVVVEAAARSGANNTASWASECGRVLMAVPGPVHSALSTTPHRLIRDSKATLVADATDVRALVAPLHEAPELAVGGAQRPLDGLDEALLAVREVLPARGAMSTAEIARRAGMSIPGTLASLAELEALELAAADEMSGWRIRSPHSR